MSEVSNNISTPSGRFRTSRYPGFTSGKVNAVTGNLAPPSSAALSGLNERVGETTKQAGSALRDVYADNFDIPEIKTPSVGDMVKGALPGAGAYYGSKLGEEYGAGVAGKLIGDDAGKALAAPLPTFFGEGGKISTAFKYDTALGSEQTAQLAADDLAFSEAGGTFGGAAGAGAGSAIGTFFATGDVGKSAKSGAASAAGYAIGNAIAPGIGGPIGSFVGSAAGGRVVCTELHRIGLLSDELFDLDVAFTITLPDSVVRGYHFLFVPYVRLMRKFQWAVAIAEPLARWRAEEVAYQMGCRKRGNWNGKIVRFVGENLCRVIGWFVSPTDWTVLNQEKTQCNLQA